ncbi:SAM-dependent methyltransferase [Lipingzhangella halophila]|uniref:SAM-dependent methyltransferase n=1 Tax=Lipingzhangella halophila TaxID=1783352 RepID=A0A7W7W6K7_9ACTN|nr:class I SAM-dependent methyltransferase [Lipingzhangella halophila]MBB4934935.1 SAM-dependent methyltransferase [Lipingzhangella halophila]
MTTTSQFNARRYWNKRLKRDWSLHGVGMVQLAHSYNRWMYRVRRQVFQRTVRTSRIDVARSDVLDIGSGTGFYIDLWQKLGARQVNGVDIADSAVAKLTKAFPGVRFERGDISEELPFEPASFDAISAFDVLIHVVDDDKYHQALHNIHDLLKPGGTFVFSEPFPHDRRVGNGKHHLCRRLDEVQDALVEAGFEIVSRRPMFSIMASPVDTAKKWRRDLWYKRLVPILNKPFWGGAAGGLMFPFELLLTRVKRESVSMELMVCRKPADS